ncbi:MAG TPA: prepilin-type N-terminal cleavage/methylation domain-containing protein [Pyrinomonadaceae bacterium]|jgi:type IV pilus assembly protein PilV|nr:prepilin-type N-terminal cleavage/methylation domain-containing protein [Pyrinomonadaceae bacterium]
METHTTQKKARGFTLIETCIALVLLMIILSGVAPLCVYAIKYNSAAAIRAGALTVAQRKLEQLRASSFTSCVSSSEILSVGPTMGSQTYTVDVTVTDVSGTVKNIKIVVTPQGRSTGGSVYEGTDGWMRGQVIVYTKRTTLGTGPNLG